MTVNSGRGYVPADENTKKIMPLEHLLARFYLYTSYKSQLSKFRLSCGSNDGFDKLTLEILTNGTIIPEDALGLSSTYLDRAL